MRAGGRALSVATWNVHGCIGRDGRHDPDRAVAVIHELRADVVALQEVDSRTRERGVGALESLVRGAGYEAIAGPTLRAHRGEYGNALLTRLPVKCVERIDLSVPGREPRGAIDAELESARGPLRVIATHLGLRRRERRDQVAQLLEIVERPGGGPLILLGDMNEWRPGRTCLRALDRRLGRSHALRTFPAHRPILRLDRIWTSPAHLVQTVRVHATPLARAASDHLPVLAEIRLP